MVAILCRLQNVAKFTISYNSDNPGTVNQAQVRPQIFRTAASTVPRCRPALSVLIICCKLPLRALLPCMRIGRMRTDARLTPERRWVGNMTLDVLFCHRRCLRCRRRSSLLRSTRRPRRRSASAPPFPRRTSTRVSKAIKLPHFYMLEVRQSAWACQPAR